MTLEGFFTRVAQLMEQSEEFAIATVIKSQGSTPRKAGAKMLVFPDGRIEGSVGGGPMEARVIEDAREAMAKGESRTYSYDLYPEGDRPVGAICGGGAEVFIEVARRCPELLVFGGGHIGIRLSEMGVFLGFRVCVADDRPEYASRERFSKACEVVLTSPRFEGGLPPVRENTYVVIATRCHETDERVLRNVLGKGAAYLGMVASHKKALEVFNKLESEGFDREALGRVHAPVGLPIGGDSPEEIALSIMAEVVALKNGKGDLSKPLDG